MTIVDISSPGRGDCFSFQRGRRPLPLSLHATRRTDIANTEGNRGRSPRPSSGNRHPSVLDARRKRIPRQLVHRATNIENATMRIKMPAVRIAQGEWQPEKERCFFCLLASDGCCVA